MNSILATRFILPILVMGLDDPQDSLEPLRSPETSQDYWKAFGGVEEFYTEEDVAPQTRSPGKRKAGNAAIPKNKKPKPSSSDLDGPTRIVMPLSYMLNSLTSFVRAFFDDLIQRLAKRDISFGVQFELARFISNATHDHLSDTLTDDVLDALSGRILWLQRSRTCIQA